MITEKFNLISSNFKNEEDLFRIQVAREKQYRAFTTKEDLEKLYNSNITKNIDFNKLKKVYFDPACTFPRFKLSNFTNTKRCLSIDKADAVIITVPVFDNLEWMSSIVFHSPSINEFYLMQEHVLSNTFVINHFGKGVAINDVLNYLINIELVEPDTKFIFKGKPIILSETVYKSLLNIGTTLSKPFILDTDLDKAISQIQSVPDEDELKAIKEYLSSNDSATVELGMKLLLNFNITCKACTIGLLLLKNNRKIVATNAIDSVGFKNLLNSLNLTKNQLLYFTQSDIPRYLNNFYAISTDEDDKANARKEVVGILTEWLTDHFKSYENITNPLNIKGEIKLY